MSKKQALTPWFPSNVKPARVGWYQTTADDRGAVSWYLWWWDGNVWLSAREGWHAEFQERSWRGLAKEPK